MRRASSRIPSLCILILTALLAACGQATTGRAATTPAPTLVPTATPAPTAIPTVNLTAGQPCAPGPHDTHTYYQLGDLVVRQVSFGLAYPSQQIPDGTPLAPLKLTNNVVNNEFPGSPAVNPHLQEPGGGFGFAVCNASATQSHVLQSVSVKIQSATPYTGQLSSWQFCDGDYARPGPAFFGGCGGGYAGDEYLHAGFAADAGAGASVVVAQTGTGVTSLFGDQKAPPLPLTLPFGKFVEINVGLTAPTAAATYVFSFAVTVDGAAPVYFSDSQPTLLAPVAHKWTGPACEKSAMLAQIPTTVTNPPTRYICPES
jgi:hypothetical protein